MSGPHILLSAYQCGPGMGSVSQIGWEWYSRLCRKTQVTLVTHVRNRDSLAMAGAPFAGSEIIYIDTEWFAGPLNRFAKRLFPRSEHSVFLLSSLDFYVYDIVAIRQLRSNKSRSWDLVHAVTPVSPLAATRLYKLGLPLVLGPWNGGLTSPKTFPEIMKEDSGWLYGIRSLGRGIDWLNGSTRHAAQILVATQATEEALPHSCHTRIRRMLENGVDLELFQPNLSNRHDTMRPLRVLFVGRLIPAKAVTLLLEAVRRLTDEVPVYVTITGAGPLLADLQREAAEKGITDKVEFTGNLPLEQVKERMQKADLFCLPSVRESGGAVLLEAMACAVPIAGVQWGGPGEIVDDEVGRMLSAAGPEALARDLVQLLRDAYSQPEVWRQKGLAGRRRAEQKYGWEAKINAALKIYEEALTARSKVEYV